MDSFFKHILNTSSVFVLMVGFLWGGLHVSLHMFDPEMSLTIRFVGVISLILGIRILWRTYIRKIIDPD